MIIVYAIALLAYVALWGWLMETFISSSHFYVFLLASIGPPVIIAAVLCQLHAWGWL